MKVLARTSTEPRSRALQWIIAFALAAFLLYYSLRGIQWRDVWRILASTEWRYVALVIVIGTASLFLRALRWRVLLGAARTVRVSTAFWATCAGYVGNAFLPARAGELVRTMVLSKEADLGRTFVLTTAMSERLTDAITLVVISSIVLLTLPFRPGWLADAAKPFALIAFCGAIAIAILPKIEPLCKSILRRTPAPDRLREKLAHVLEQVLHGLRSFHDTRRLLTFIAFTGIIWLLDAIGTVTGARALGLNVSFPVAFLLISGLGLGSALPSTPGYVGIYQFVAVTVLTPFGFSRADAIAYILLVQALQYVGLSIWGLLVIIRFRELSMHIPGFRGRDTVEASTVAVDFTAKPSR